MTNNDSSEGRRRRSATPAPDVPASGSAPQGQVIRAADIYPHWEEITEQVMSSFVAHGREGGDFNAGIEETTFQRLVDRVCDQNPHWGIRPAQRSELVTFLRNEFFGYGPLAPYMDIEGLEEIMCNRYDRVFYIVHGKKMRMDPSPFRNEKDVRDFLSRVFAAQGRELTLSNPMEDGHLADGSRIHAEIPPLAVLGSAFAIRKFNPRPFTMEQYLETGMFTERFLTSLKSWVNSNQNIVISGGTASGKAQPLDAKVLTPTGFRTMGDMAVGDEIVGADGNPHHVTGVFPQGKKEIFKVSFSDGAVAESCGEHLWSVSDDGDPHETLPLAQIRVAGLGSADDLRWSVPLVAPVAGSVPDGELQMHPYLLGALLGASPVQPGIGVAEAAEQLARSGVVSLPLGARRHIPSPYLHASEAARCELLAGLLDAAGWVIGAEFGYLTPESALADDVAHLVRSLGGITAPAPFTAASGARVGISIRLPENVLVPCRNPDIQRLLSQGTRSRPERMIVAIEPVGVEPCQCISVSAPDGLYLTDGYVVTHNTTFINAVGALIPKDDRLIVIENTKELQIETEDTLYIQAMMKGSHEGDGERSMTIRDGVRGALRLTPDRIIVGEVRSREALDLLQALNTGHDGSWTTIHANTAVDAISRLESLAIMADELPMDAIQDLIARAVDIVIQVGRFRGSAYRRVIEAWQVLHPHQIDPRDRHLLAAIRDRGELQKIRNRMYALPLYTADENGTLVHRNDVVPVMGKRASSGSTTT